MRFSASNISEERHGITRRDQPREESGFDVKDVGGRFSCTKHAHRSVGARLLARHYVLVEALGKLRGPLGSSRPIPATDSSVVVGVDPPYCFRLRPKIIDPSLGALALTYLEMPLEARLHRLS